jgi:prevent-host-death family protein
MNKVTVAEARDKLIEALRRVKRDGERIVITRNGRRVAALVPIDEYDFLERLEDEYLNKAADEAMKEKGFVTLEEVKARLGMK